MISTARQTEQVDNAALTTVRGHAEQAPTAARGRRQRDPAHHKDKKISKLASMLDDMTRITVTMDDRLAAAVRATAGHNVSGWLADLVRHTLLEQAVTAEIACDQQHPDYLTWRDERLEEIEEAHA
jgi:hypothetical protein